MTTQRHALERAARALLGFVRYVYLITLAIGVLTQAAAALLFYVLVKPRRDR